MIDKYKYYIRVDKDGIIIDSYSDAFREFQEGDILIGEGYERCWRIDLVTIEGLYRYRWNGKEIVKRTDDEIYDSEYKTKIKDSEAKKNLGDIDLKSIRAIREYIAKQKDCPVELQQYEVEAISTRSELKSANNAEV